MDPGSVRQNVSLGGPDDHGPYKETHGRASFFFRNSPCRNGSSVRKSALCSLPSPGWKNSDRSCCSRGFPYAGSDCPFSDRPFWREKSGRIDSACPKMPWKRSSLRPTVRVSKTARDPVFSRSIFRLSDFAGRRLLPAFPALFEAGQPAVGPSGRSYSDWLRPPFQRDDPRSSGFRREPRQTIKNRIVRSMISGPSRPGLLS